MEQGPYEPTEPAQEPDDGPSPPPAPDAGAATGPSAGRSQPPPPDPTTAADVVLGRRASEPTEVEPGWDPPHPATPPTDPPQRPPPQAPGRDDDAVRAAQAAVATEWRSGTLVAGLPLALWAVIALFAACGAYFVWIALEALSPTLELLTNGLFGLRFALVLLLLLLLVGALGVGLLAIALMLYRASRVGRGLAYVVAGMVVTSVLFGGDPSNGAVVAMFLSIGAAAILGLAPAVRAVFTGPGAPDTDQPTSIVVARVCVILWVAFAVVLALVYPLLGTLESEYLVYALALGGVAAGGFLLYRRLATPDRQARLILTVVSAIGIAAQLAAQDVADASLGIGLLAAVPLILWFAPDARAFYGDRPLTAPSTP